MTSIETSPPLGALARIFTKNYQWEAINLLRALLLFLVCFLASSCEDYSERQLGGGYVLAYMNGCDVSIYNKDSAESSSWRVPVTRKSGCDMTPGKMRNGPMLNGNIESYAVRENYVTGYESLKCFDPKVGGGCEGYYLLNTASQEQIEGLSEEEWKAELGKIGWVNPALTKLRKSGESIKP